MTLKLGRQKSQTFSMSNFPKSVALAIPFCLSSFRKSHVSDALEKKCSVQKERTTKIQAIYFQFIQKELA